MKLFIIIFFIMNMSPNGFNCEISETEKEQIFKNLYFFEKKLNYKNIFSYELKIQKNDEFKIMTINNIDSISINTIDYVRFILDIFKIQKNEEEIKKSSILFSKGHDFIDSNYFNNNNIKTPHQIYVGNNINEIISYNTYLNDIMSIFTKKLLKIDKQIKKINSYYEMNNDVYSIRALDNCMETIMDDDFYLVKIISNRILIISKIFFTNEKINSNDISQSKKEFTLQLIKPINAYKLWSIEEENDLLMELRNDTIIEKIAKIHERSIGGIEARIKKIIINMFIEDKNMSQICDELHITKDKIKNMLEKNYCR